MPTSKRPRPLRRVMERMVRAKTPEENLDKAIEYARRKGRYMVAVFTLNGAEVELYRRTEQWPLDAHDKAVQELASQLAAAAAAALEDD